MTDQLSSLRHTLDRLLVQMRRTEAQWFATIAGVHPDQRLSATNLLHYLTLRNEDLRNIQDDLHNAGLSSLASSESHALRQVQEVSARLGVKIPEKELSPCDYPTANRMLQQRAGALFGSKVNPNIPFLMVTFDTGMADNYTAVKNLVKAGMNVARINCAHDNPDVWGRMIANLRKASRATGHPCKVYLDLAGPKIRTMILGKGHKKGRLRIREGEEFLLVEQSADYSRHDKVVGCTLPGVVKDLRAGDRVLFDDGLLEAVVQKSDGQIARLQLTRASVPKPRLKPEKGINFPDSELSVRCLTEFDRSVLPFAHAHADIVGFSFVRQPEEVAELQELLRRSNGTALPLVLKIETYEAVQNLPRLLMQGMAGPVFGVMIARGDLAVEIGFERLSEIQEEILWICEAAHVPVIWATQVLETLNKSGIATRSEGTDAAHAAHAECVMLNKGKFLLEVLATLRDILHRSGGHHLKKRYVFRPLSIAGQFLKNAPASSNGSHRRSLRKTGTR